MALNSYESPQVTDKPFRKRVNLRRRQLGMALLAVVIAFIVWLDSLGR